MKKKFAVTLLALCAVTAFAFGLAACDLIGGDHGDTAHTHNYVLKYDETYHWQECMVSGCTAKTIDRTVHSFDGDICKGCGYKKGEPPVEKDEPSVEGFTYVFDSVKLNCNDESLLDMLKMLEANLSIMLKGTAMTFSAGGKCTSVSGGITSEGVYEQDGAKLTVTVGGETSEMQVTETGISVTGPFDLGEQMLPELENAEITLTVTYIKGTVEITPPTPGEECEHVYDKYEPLNDEQHNVYCEKCEDVKIENHNVSGEFGICVCGWHNHIPSEKWETSDYYHWHNCTVSGCHERLDYGMHDRTDGSCVCERNGEVFKFTLNDDGESYCFELVYEKTLTEVIIPAEYSGKPVTSIGWKAFENCNSLESVTIPKSVTSISGGFWNCDSLESIYYDGDIADWCAVNGIYRLTENLIINKVYIGNEKLSEMTSVTIPDGVTSIAFGAFYACRKLESVTIPNSVTVIGNSAFAGCHVLNNVNIPYGVEIIEGNAFGDCFALSDISLPDSLTEIGVNAFYQCTALTEITIKKKKKKLGLSAAGNYYSIFEKCKNLKKVIWNSECSAEATFTSADTPDVSLIIGENVKTIDYSAFFECDGITSVTIPGSVTSIKDGAFGACSGLTSVSIGNGVTSIGSAFGGCSGLTSVIIPDSVTNIGDYAFRGCSGLTSVSIGNGVTSIGDYAFRGCSGLTSVSIGNSVTSFGYEAFKGCPIETAHIPTNACGIIRNDNLKTVIVTSGDSIYDDAFRGCSGLTSVSIGNSVTSFGYEAFKGCSELTSITFNGTIEQWKAIEKGYFWNSGTGEYTVFCTDGNLSKSES